MANLNTMESRRCYVKIPTDALQLMNLEQNDLFCEAVDILTDEKIFYNMIEIDSKGVMLDLKPADIKIIKL